MASAIDLFSKNVTTSSRFFSVAPPDETITGRRVDAIFSSSGQAFTSEDATLMSGKSNSTHMSTDASSKGVAIGMQPTLRISVTMRAKSSRSIFVASVFLM